MAHERSTPFELSPEQLYRACSPEELSLIEEVIKGKPPKDEPLTSFIGIGQDRFLSALKMGVGVEDPLNNIFVVGMTGPIGFSACEYFLKKLIKKSRTKFPEPRDWCYLYNFENPQAPIAVSFSKGKAALFRKKVELLLNQVRKRILKAVESAFLDELKKSNDALKESAREAGFEMKGEIPGRVRFTMLDGSGVSDKKNAKHKKKYQEFLKKFSAEVNSYMSAAKQAVANRLEEISVGVIESLFDHTQIFQKLGEREQSLNRDSAIIKYFDGLKEYSCENYMLFVPMSEPEEKPQRQLVREISILVNPYLPWGVNVFVDHSETDGVPVVVDHEATTSSLSGTVRQSIARGMAYTDHGKIFPGSIAEANGGFLIIDAEDVLKSEFGRPVHWEYLKYAIKSGYVVPYTSSPQGVGISDLEPTPIPLNVKVVLFGSREVFDRVLLRYDKEFSELFRIRAEIVPNIKRTPEHIKAYALWLKCFVEHEKINNLTVGATARLIEYLSRLSGRQDELSVDYGELFAVVQEACFFANEQSKDGEHFEITEEHVDEALRSRIWRSNFSHERYQMMVKEQTYLVPVSGSRVGQITGLAVSEHGGKSFGVLMRISASTNVGRANITSIARNSKLTGKSYDQADTTVLALIKRNFSQEFPLTFEGFVSFEQSYSTIDGDSASLAQYYSILSSVAEVPIKGDVAITGSLSTHGDIQPIGGENEKIEIFFDVCKTVGALTGTQGVIIPWQNEKNLMLRRDIVDAVREKKFHIWPIRSLDEGAQILTGLPSGAFDERVHQGLQTLRRKAIKAEQEMRIPLQPKE